MSVFATHLQVYLQVHLPEECPLQCVCLQTPFHFFCGGVYLFEERPLEYVLELGGSLGKPDGGQGLGTLGVQERLAVRLCGVQDGVPAVHQALEVVLQDPKGLPLGGRQHLGPPVRRPAEARRDPRQPRALLLRRHAPRQHHRVQPRQQPLHTGTPGAQRERESEAAFL